MRTMRQDAWTAEDDRVLADILIRHIRQGSTQLAAFEEAASVLGRTAAACGYRWNAVVRNFHRDSIQIAKLERKSSIHPLPIDSSHPQTASISEKESSMPAGLDYGVAKKLDGESPPWIQILKLLRLYKKQYDGLIARVKHYENACQLETQVTTNLMLEIDSLKKRLERLQEEHNLVKGEYHSLLSIFDRARRISEETMT